MESAHWGATAIVVSEPWFASIIHKKKRVDWLPREGDEAKNAGDAHFT